MTKCKQLPISHLKIQVNKSTASGPDRSEGKAGEIPLSFKFLLMVLTLRYITSIVLADFKWQS